MKTLPFRLIAFFMVFHVDPLNAQWIPASGPYEASVQCMLVTAEKIFIGTTLGGVFLSTDSGISWSPRSKGLYPPYVYSLLATEQALFAGTNGGGLFVTQDEGLSWTKTSLPFPNIYSLMAVHNQTSNVTIYAGTSDQTWTVGDGIYRSTDLGLTWNQANQGLTMKSVVSLAQKDSILFAEAIEWLQQPTGAVFRSIDNGDS